MSNNFLIVIALVFAAFLLSAIVFFLKKDKHTLPLQIFASISISAIAVLVLDLSAADLGFTNVLPGLLWGVSISALVTLVIYIASKTQKTRSLFLDDRTKNVSKGRVLYRVFVDIPIGTVLFEEILFRGVLFGYFAAVHNYTSAIIVSSALFGLWHMLPSLSFAKENNKAPAKLPTIIGTVLFTALSGVAFAFLRMISGSILAPIALHYAVNTSSLALSWLQANSNRAKK